MSLTRGQKSLGVLARARAYRVSGRTEAGCQRAGKQADKVRAGSKRQGSG